MKTAEQITDYRPKFRQLSVFTFLTLLSFQTLAADTNKVNIKRGPASAYEEEVLTVPLETKPVMKTLFAEDDAGVMAGMRNQLSAWEEKEEYARIWNIQSTNLYKTPSTNEKTKFIAKNLTRYADKRLAGEMKNAEEGSTMASVSKMEKSLRPNASVPVNKYIAIKFKARVLQGKAIMEVRNPWVDCSATVGANGKTRILTKKDFNQLGTSTGVEYNVNDSQWVAFVDQEITQNIKARLSSTSQPNGNDADKRMEMSASFPFNL
jgi:hypothetical protein